MYQSLQHVAGMARAREGHKPKLLDRVREAIRLRHDSVRTEGAYVSWIKRFILFHGKRHPLELGEDEITRFFSALAVRERAARRRIRRSVRRSFCTAMPSTRSWAGWTMLSAPSGRNVYRSC